MRPVRQIEYGYRVVWDIGWWLDYRTYEEAHELCCALERLPAFEDELFRPYIFAIRDGEMKPDPVWPWLTAVGA